MDHVTRNALAARNNEAHGQGYGRQSFRTGLLCHYGVEDTETTDYELRLDERLDLLTSRACEREA